MAYLGVIEERTNHILATYAARKKEMELRAMDMLSNGSMTKLKNEMPSFGKFLKGKLWSKMM